MSESIKVSAVMPADAKTVYNAWLSSREHSRFTGSRAVIDPRIGGKFTAWDNYIQGTTLELEQDKRVVQLWRTTEFPEGSKDSKLEIFFENVKGGARITISHTDIPEGQGGQYKQGWLEYYFRPMKEYFKARKQL